MNFPFQSKKIKILLIAVLIFCGVASRLLPHPFNFTPITAITLFVASYFGIRYSLVTLFGIMLLSDLYIGFYSWEMMLIVYSSFALVSLFGFFIKKQKIEIIILSTLGASLSFYIITNWAVWQFGSLYEHSLFGLLQSYTAAIPFFKNSLAGDIFFTTMLFGSVYVVHKLRRLGLPRFFYKRKILQQL